MRFVAILNAGSETVESLKLDTTGPNNDFSLAAMMAAAALFAREGVDNVTCYVLRPDGTVPEDNFFYAEKG